ncbi:MAG: hypothetical protein FJX47_18830 [Alphaproteobacteria bacterium]|nr:hypothetical protein [Alphaproteobacteria bacterium]
MSREIIAIEDRFRGPSRSGNGGYVGGVMARRFSGLCEVTFRRPIPLDRPLDLDGDGATSRLADAEGEIAGATRIDGHLTLDIPKPPPWSACVAASAQGGSRSPSDFATCFSCGRDHPEGLHVWSGPVAGTQLVAAAWHPRREHGRANGRLPSEFLWSALDCIGGIALGHGLPPADMLTGRMCAEVDDDLATETDYRVVGWVIGAEGRKRHAGTAIFDAAKRVRARARAVWVVLKA